MKTALLFLFLVVSLSTAEAQVAGVVIKATLAGKEYTFGIWGAFAVETVGKAKAPAVAEKPRSITLRLSLHTPERKQVAPDYRGIPEKSYGSSRNTLDPRYGNTWRPTGTSEHLYERKNK